MRGTRAGGQVHEPGRALPIFSGTKCAERWLRAEQWLPQLDRCQKMDPMAFDAKVFLPVCREAFPSTEALSSHYVAQHGKSKASAVPQPILSLVHASGGATMSSTQRVSRDRTLSIVQHSAFEDVAEYASLLSKVLDGVATSSEASDAARESTAAGIDVAAA